MTQRTVGITTITPSDVRTWRHSDAQFLMMLSGACGWTARLEANKGGKLHSKSGQSMLIPDNTGLKMGVFKSWASKIVTHADRKPTAKAVFELMEECHLDPSHRSAVWSAIGMTPYVPPAPGGKETSVEGDRFKVMAGGQTVFTSDDMAAAAQLAEEQVTAESGPFKVIEIATGKLMATVVYKPGARAVKSLLPWVRSDQSMSHAVLERTWNDGTVDWVCSWDGCDYRADNPLRVGPHYRAHTGKAAQRRSEQAPVVQLAEAPAQTRDGAGSSPAGGTGFTPMAVSGGGSERERVEEFFDSLLDSAEAKLRRIIAVVAPEYERTIAELTAERDAALRRAVAAEGKLETLRSLFGAP